MRIIMIATAAGATLLSLATLSPAIAAAQAGDGVKAYIDAGFAKMDANRDGKVDRAEFDRFMRDRLARQGRQFDAMFAEIDANKDGRISRAEAATAPGIRDNFTDVDANGDGSIDKAELRRAAAAAQMQEAGLSD